MIIKTNGKIYLEKIEKEHKKNALIYIKQIEKLLKGNTIKEKYWLDKEAKLLINQLLVNL